MSIPRHRTMNVSGLSGFRTTFGGAVVHSSFDSVTKSMDDSVGSKGDAHPLLIEEYRRDPFFVNGEYRYFGEPMKWVNFVEDYTRLTTEYHVLDGLAPLNLDEMTTKLLASTNPSKPTFSVPTFIGELKDVPSLIKATGDGLLKGSANSWLAYNFGWKPLMSDLSNLFNVENILSRKMDELNRLYSNQGLKRSRSFGWTTARQGKTVSGHSSSYSMTLDAFLHTEQKIWGSVRWVPDTPAPIGRRGMLDLARKAAFGLSSDPYNVLSTVWNLMPWSWLVDWFSNVGEFIDAKRNTIPSHPTNICIMRQRTTKIVYTPRPHGPLVGGGGRAERLTKERWVRTAPVLTATNPILSDYQLSIIAALLVQRSK